MSRGRAAHLKVLARKVHPTLPHNFDNIQAMEM
jgi:hypothetical protein